MWSPEELKTVVPLGQALLTGLFAVAVAVLTWKLTGRREQMKLQQEQQMQHYKAMEELYTSLLEMVHEGIRYTEARLNYDAYYQSMSPLLSRAMLKAPEAVLQQLQTTCDGLSAWSSAYRKGLPLMLGDTGIGMVSNLDFPHQERARELRPLLNNELHELNAVMKKDLDSRRQQLRP
jgi:hypothetical protein